MDELSLQIMALVLNQGEHLTRFNITSGLKESFVVNDKEDIGTAISKLMKSDVLIELDPEWDVLYGEDLLHDDHGSLSASDFTFSFDNLLSLGPAAISFVEENVVLLRKICSDVSLPNASARLGALRIDSSSWTGIPSNFRFTAENQRHVIRMLRAADAQLEASGLPNSQTAQAKAYINAALMIAEAPDPQPDLIWEIIQRGGALSSIGQFFIAIIALFKG